MKVAVLGGSGFIGSHVCESLSLKGYKVNIFDIKKSKYKTKKQKMYLGSILSKKQLSLAIKGCDYVYHFAALADIDASSDKPLETAKINILGTINALEVCKKHKIKRFFFASSLYANTEEGSFYGPSKQAAERYIEKFYKNFGLNYTILRFGSLYGSRSGNSNGIKSLINNAVNNKKIVYEGSKRAERMYVHVEDVANVCVKIIQEKYKNKYLTITDKRIVKVRNLIKMIAKHLKISKSKIKYLNRKNHGHYDKKPTLFSPRIGNKLTIKEQKDFKKRIINLIH